MSQARAKRSCLILLHKPGKLHPCLRGMQFAGCKNTELLSEVFACNIK